MSMFATMIRKMQDKRAKKMLSGKHGKMYVDQIDMIKNIQYAPIDDEFHKLDVLSPKGAQGKLPTIVVMHGGAYFFCSKEMNELQSRYFASRGFRVVNINYRLMPEVLFDGVMQDLFTVFHWIGENADTFGFDTEKVYLTGDSAGGHYTLIASAIFNNENLAKAYNVQLPIYSIAGFAATCPAVCADALTMPNSRLAKMLTPEQQQSLREFPYFNMYDILEKCKLPHVLINTTEHDAILYTETKKFHEDLVQRGVDHVYKEYASKGNKLEHVFNVLYPEWPESIEANEDIINFFKKN